MRMIGEYAKVIFMEAVEKHSPAEWAAFLDEACGNDDKLRQRVEDLLHTHSDKNSISEGIERTIEHQPLMQVGQMIGPYNIREQIGDGGMGVVYVADQKRPLRRTVALKVIKPGMDTKAVLARFDAERNALALMNHPNIAKVLDAGTTEQGRPYFVMELVSGTPITEYCEEHKLGRERLGLFTQVCQAIQHAHQKGIIHRDLKPSNVLVTELDGQPIPKVIHFGIAKALNQSLTEHSIYTSFQSVVGTPLYMSPEQAKLSAADVDTRSDVYSLGVLLYELLTGTTPFDKRQFERVTFEQIRRFICETDPPKPSARINTLGKSATAKSANRGTDVRADLDWIVMKALEKDRSRWYESASALAADVRRYLRGEPIEARPPSAVYRLSKFAQRNRGAIVGVATIMSALLIGFASAPVAITSFVILALGVGGSLAGLGFLQARRDAKRASAAADDALQSNRKLSQLLYQYEDSQTENAFTAALGGNIEQTEAIAAKLGEIAEHLRPGQPPQHHTALLRGVAYHFGGENAKALGEFRRAAELRPRSTVARSLMVIGSVLNGEWTEQQHQLARLRDQDDDGQKTLLDEFLQAYALVQLVPNAAADKLRRIVEQRPYWPIGHVILAEALGHVIFDRGDASVVEEAIRENQIAQVGLSQNPYVLANALWVYTAAIHANQLKEVERELTREAERYLRQLRESFPEFPLGRLCCACYLETAGRKREAMKEWERGGFADHCAAVFCREQKCEEGLRALEQVHTGFGAKLARLQLKIEIPHLQRTVMSEYEELISDPRYASGVFVAEAVVIPLRLGLLQTAKQTASRILATQTGGSDVPGWGLSVARYVAGEISESELADTAAGSNYATGNVFYWIGLHRLASGDREGARVAFQRCLETGVPILFRLIWADAFLSRMRSDPNWPNWVTHERVSAE